MGENQLFLSLHRGKHRPTSFLHKCPQKGHCGSKSCLCGPGICVDWKKAALSEEGKEPVSVKKAGAFDLGSGPSPMGRTGLEREQWVRSPLRKEFEVHTTPFGSMHLKYLTPWGRSSSLQKDEFFFLPRGCLLMGNVSLLKDEEFRRSDSTQVRKAGPFPLCSQYRPQHLPSTCLYL